MLSDMNRSRMHDTMMSSETGERAERSVTASSFWCMAAPVDCLFMFVGSAATAKRKKKYQYEEKRECEPQPKRQVGRAGVANGVGWEEGPVNSPFSHGDAKYGNPSGSNSAQLTLWTLSMWPNRVDRFHRHRATTSTVFPNCIPNKKTTQIYDILSQRT